MANFNKIILVGNLTRDVDIRYIPSGEAKAKLGIAVNKKVKGEDKTMFIDVDVWGKTGEACAEYLKKGSPALIEGELDFQTWEADGQRRSKHVVRAHKVEFLGERRKQKDDSGDDVPF